VASAALRNWGWMLAAGLAAAFLGVLALHGERPEPGLDRFEPAGLLLDWPVDEVVALDVAAGPRRRAFRRVGASWRVDGAVIAGEIEQNIALGLKLLRNSAPQRIFAATEIDQAALSNFGLAAPRLTVAARTGAGRSITILFGGYNPLGLARYTRVDGQGEVVLLPSFVAEAWERLLQTR
jgi:Domain of unknown function (DUF4340)